MKTIAFSCRLLLLLLCFLQAQAQNNYTVNNLLDDGPGSLRQATYDASAGGSGTITVDASLAGDTIKLQSCLSIGVPITLEGNGIIISGGDSCQILNIPSYQSVIRRVHFTQGNSNANGGAIYAKSGGTIESCIFSGNTSIWGGAIYSDGILDIRGCTFYNNTAISGGAIFVGGGTTTLTGNIFYDNIAGNGGDVIYNFTTTTSGGYNVYDNTSYDFTFGSEDTQVSMPQVAPASLKLLAGSEATTSRIPNRPAEYPTTDFYGKSVPATNAASGAVQETAAAGWAVDYAVRGNGTVTISPAPNSDGLYADGANVTLTATPGQGAVLLKWVVDGVDNPETTTTITLTNLTAHHTVRAQFMTTYAVTNFLDEYGAGTLRQAIMDAYYTYGGIITVDDSLAGDTIKLQNFLHAQVPIILEGNGIIISGGGSHQILRADAPIVIRRVHFTQGMSSEGGAIDANNGGTIESCIFSGNTADWSGAIDINDAFDIRGCTFYNNTAVNEGGAIYVNSGTTTLTGNIFYGNTAGNDGDVIFNAATVNSGGYNVYDNTSYDFTFGADDVDTSTSGLAPIDPATFEPVNDALGVLTALPAGYPAADFNGKAIAAGGAAGAVQPASMTKTITIDTPPATALTVTFGSITESLTAAATVSDGSAPAYQWYSCDDDTGVNAQPVSGATAATFALPTTLAAGTYYYYVAVSASGAATVMSGVTTVTVDPAPVQRTYGLSFAVTGRGTVTSAYATYPENALVTLTLAPEANYALKEISAYETGDDTNTLALDGSGDTRTFTMPAYGVTVAAAFHNPDSVAVATAKGLIEGAAFAALAQATANDAVAIRDWLATQINVLAGMAATGITVAPADITVSNLTAAANGTDGSFDFSVALALTGASDNAAQTGLAIIATPVVIVNAATPVITTQPQVTQTVPFNGTPTALAVVATISDGGTPSYQWYSNTTDSNTGGTAISGKTAASFTPPTSADGTFYYYAIVTNTNNGVNGTKTATTASQVATVIVEAPVNAETPVITGHPQDATYAQNATANDLTVTASAGDGGTLSYQWYSNTSDSNSGGTAISGTDSPSFTPPTNAIGTTYYYVVVTNTNNSATGTTTAEASSNTAAVVVNNLVNAAVPAIGTQPRDTSVTVGENLALAVTATVGDGGTLSYQWYSNTSATNSGGTAVGTNSATYQPATTVAGTYYYYVVVTNTKTGITGNQTASTASNAATVTVTPAIVDAATPSITTQPQDASVTAGNAVTLMVVASAGDSGTLSYQWYSGSTAISGAESDSYSPPTGTAGTATYYVVVTNTNTAATGARTATATSRTATVTVTAPTTPTTPTVDTYTVSIATMVNGSVSASPATAEAGQTVTLDITPADGYELASIAANAGSTSVSLSGSGNSRTFTMPAANVTVSATFRKTQEQFDKDTIGYAQTGIETGSFRVAQMTANVSDPLHTWLVNALNYLYGDRYGISFRSTASVIGDVTITSVTPAIAGTEDNPDGTDGAFTFTVKLTKGSSSATTAPTHGTIIAVPYGTTKRVEMLNLGGLAVRIMNTGNVATGKLTLALAGTGADSFSLLPATLDGLAVGDEADIMLVPAASLASGIYALTLTASADAMEDATFAITYSTYAVGSLPDPSQGGALRAAATDGGLYISGLKADAALYIYNVRGQLVYSGKAAAAEQLVRLRDKGIYIVTNGGETVKAMYVSASSGIRRE